MEFKVKYLKDTTELDYEFPEVENCTVDTYLEDAIERGQKVDQEANYLYFGFELPAPAEYLFSEWLRVMRSYIQLLKLSDEAGTFIRNITIEEWVNRRLSDGRKLGKRLKQLGFSQRAVDFDGSQERCSDARYGLIFNPNYWARLGMSSLANPDSWDGYNGTSCQDFRHDEADYSKHVLASTSNSFYVIQLIRLFDRERLEDFTSYESMRDRLEARTLCDFAGGRFRYSTMYGNNKSKLILSTYLDNLLENGLDVQNGLKYDGSDYTIVKGLKAFTITDWIYINVSISEKMETECPLCEGSRKIDATGSNGCEYEIWCPHCNGTGYISTWVEVEHEEEMEDEIDLFPYEEGIFHGNRIKHSRSPKGLTFGEWTMKMG